MPLRPREVGVLLAVCAIGTVGLVYLGVAADRSGPAAVVEERSGPFRGDELPADLTGAAAPSFSHRDARGGSFGTGDAAGKPYAVTFLFTQCPDVCPLIGQQLRQALEILGPRAEDVEVMAVSVDPEGDTVEAARTWLDRHHLPANFHYLTGSQRELAPTWDAYFTGRQPPGRRESIHTASIWLVDANGRLRTKFSAGVPVAPADIAHDLGLLIDDAERGTRASAAPSS